MSKKVIFLFSIIIGSLLFFVPLLSQSYAKNNNEVKVFTSGHRVTFDVPPQIINNRTMVPIRKTVETLNAVVKWDNNKRTVTVTNDAQVVYFKIGEKFIFINGKKKAIDSPATIINGRTLIPLRFLAEAFDYKVSWKNNINSVLIGTDEATMFPQDEIKIPVLMYHHFDPKLSSSTIVHPEAFGKQMALLKSKGYETITDHDLIAFMQGNKDLPEKPILVTMDDGYESNFTYAFPILKKLDMKATVYVIGERLRVNRDDHSLYEYPRLSWDEAKEMYDSGVFEIQSHTYNMHHKAKTARGYERGVITEPIYINGKLETRGQYEARVLADLKHSKQLIEEKVGNDVVSFCYPYGDFSEQSESLIKKAGFKMSLSVKPGINTRGHGSFKLYRINVPGWYSAEQMLKEIEK